MLVAETRVCIASGNCNLANTSDAELLKGASHEARNTIAVIGLYAGQGEEDRPGFQAAVVEALHRFADKNCTVPPVFENFGESGEVLSGYLHALSARNFVGLNEQIRRAACFVCRAM